MEEEEIGGEGREFGTQRQEGDGRDVGDRCRFRRGLGEVGSVRKLVSELNIFQSKICEAIAFGGKRGEGGSLLPIKFHLAYLP